MSDYIPLGSEAKLYRNTGTYGTPTWTECENVSDLEVGPLGPEMLQIGIRGMGKRKTYTPGQSDERIKGKMVWRKDSSHELYADVQAILDAGMNGTQIELLALDGDKTTVGCEGLRMTCHIKLETRTENLSEFLSIGFEAHQAPTTNATSWYVVAS